MASLSVAGLAFRKDPFEIRLVEDSLSSNLSPKKLSLNSGSSLNLSDKVWYSRHQDLKDYFRVAGEITYANAHKPRSGEGIVEFGERRGLDYALDKLDGNDLDGRRIRLVEERPNKRSRSDSRSRSRSRSRTRSRS